MCEWQVVIYCNLLNLYMQIGKHSETLRKLNVQIEKWLKILRVSFAQGNII